MNSGITGRTAILLSVFSLGVVGPAGLLTALHAQQPSEQPAGSTTIRAESRLVLVDVIVTDKKGAYVPDLAEKDFTVFEDDHEQKIKTFSFESSATPSNDSKRHLVLFFDDDGMRASDQARAREAAAKFLDSNSGPGRFFAVVDYAGTMRITQNFTDDKDRLKTVVSSAKLSTSPNLNASLSNPVFASYDSYSDRNVLLALRSVARSMSSLPGRKSLVWLTSGFPLTPDREAEMTALINTCNRANVAVYPVDVRGLSGAAIGAGAAAVRKPSLNDDAYIAYTSFQEEDATAATPRLVYVLQKGGSGGGTGGKTGGNTGGNTGANTGGGRPTTTTAPPPGALSNPMVPPRTTLVPPFPASASTNQQVLYSIASGTGGFVIANSNDLVNGLDKIGHELSQYYILGYTPASAEDGSCHALRVKVGRSGTTVRSRTGYCAVKPTDLLAGKPIAKDLEARALGSQPGDMKGSVSVPYFYTSPGTARVNLAIELPGSSVKFEKVKGKYHAVLNILGIATKADGSVAARFSDAMDLDFDKKGAEDFAARPYHYENQFYIASGQYTLKIAVNTGDKYGNLEAPLNVDAYDKAQFSMSGLALSKEFHKVADSPESLDSALLQDRTPLVTQGLQLVPSGSAQFKKSDRAAIYLEVYEPLIADSTPPKVSLKLSILDEKTGKSQLEAGVPDTGASVIAGNPVIPMGVPLPLSSLQPGTYVVELSATDSAGHSTAARKAVFSVE
jgi:VWFA-related protein